jgi:SAM-dependent methyltransferase
MVSAHPGRQAYDVGAEYYDALSAQWWEPIRPALAAALGGIDPAAGPVVELGAGTGLATEVIADVLPAATIVAVEPSTAMRAVLTARVVRSSDLAARVTIVETDRDIDTDVADTRWGGFVAVNMIGHLSPDERRSLWATVAARLAPGATVVIGPPPMARPEQLSQRRWGESRLGRHRYEVWSSAEPTGPANVRWHMTWRVFDSDRLVTERHAVNDMWTVSEPDLRGELAAAGLMVTGTEAEFTVLCSVKKSRG